MSVIDDVRKVAQDFIAPELRGINERLNALEKPVELLRSQVSKQGEDLRAEFRSGVSQILSAFQIERRLEWLEKQIPHLPPKEQ